MIQTIQLQPFSTTSVQEIGCVASILLPEGWVAGNSIKNVRGLSFFHNYRHATHPDVQLTFFYRGYRIDEPAGLAFLDVLSSAPASKATNSREMERVLGTVGDDSEFNCEWKAVETIGEKRVLVVRGKYIRSGVRAEILFASAENSGTLVQEIAYIAPEELFEQFYESGRSALSSIIWVPWAIF